MAYTQNVFFQVFKKFETDNIPVIPMSTLTDDGIMKVKTEACDLLLASRVEMKSKGRKVNDILNRLHVAQPVQRDAKSRPPCIPASVLAKKKGEIDSKPHKKLVSFLAFYV